MKLVYIKLVNGEDLIAQESEMQVEPYEPIIASYFVDAPMKVVSVPYDQHNIVLAISDWFPKSHLSVNIPISHNHIISHAFELTDEKLRDSYLRMISPKEEDNKNNFSSIRDKFKGLT